MGELGITKQDIHGWLEDMPANRSSALARVSRSWMPMTWNNSWGPSTSRHPRKVKTTPVSVSRSSNRLNSTKTSCLRCSTGSCDRPRLYAEHRRNAQWHPAVRQSQMHAYAQRVPALIPDVMKQQ